MKVLVINAGSSSCKYQLLEMDTETVLASGLAERIGQGMGKLTHKIAPDSDHEEKIVRESAFPTHVEAMELVISLLTDPEKGVIKDKSEIYAIGHRVLHGGESITETVKVDENVKQIIRDCFPLGPLHNPANLMGIEVAEKLFPGVPNVAVFDTEFGMAMPQEAYMYGLPYEIYEEMRIRRYGFHGTSHKYIAKKTAEYLGKPQSELRSITMHLGNGSSMSCVKDGKCFDTSMGLTPLEGLIMGTRCGSIDPAIVPFIMEKENLTAAEVNDLMNKKSGLLGISGISNDLRSVRQASEEGDERAQLAYDMYSNSAKKYIGQYIAVMGGVDAIVLTAGVGENCDKMRRMIFAGLQPLGIKIDLEKNRAGLRGEREISTDDSEVRIVIIPTDEEYMIARDTYQLVKEGTLEITELA